MTRAVWPEAAAQTTDSFAGMPSTGAGGTGRGSEGRPRRSPPTPHVTARVRTGAAAERFGSAFASAGRESRGVAGVGGGGGRVDGVASRDASSGRASTSWPADASGSARANRRGWSLCVGLVSPEWLRNRGRNISARAVAATHATKNAHSQRVSRGRMVVRAGVAPRRVTAVAISFGRETKRVTKRSRIDSRARTPREDASRPSPSFAAHARAPTSSQQVSSSQLARRRSLVRAWSPAPSSPPPPGASRTPRRNPPRGRARCLARGRPRASSRPSPPPPRSRAASPS